MVTSCTLAVLSEQSFYLTTSNKLQCVLMFEQQFFSQKQHETRKTCERETAGLPFSPRRGSLGSYGGNHTGERERGSGCPEVCDAPGRPVLTVGFLQCPGADEAYFIAKEILATERTYLKDLEVITVV